jgi:hypothetical protein
LRSCNASMYELLFFLDELRYDFFKKQLLG